MLNELIDHLKNYLYSYEYNQYNVHLRNECVKALHRQKNIGMASKIAYFVVFFIGLRFGFNAGKMASVSTTTSSILIAFNVSASHNLFFFLLEPSAEFGRFKSRKLSVVFLKVAFSSPKVRDFCDRKCRIDKEAFPERYRFSSFDFHWTEYKQLKNTRTTFFKKKTVIRWQTGVSLLSSSIPIRSRIFQLFFFSTARII